MHPYLQLGHLRIPVYGIFAALGLMSALALSQRTARYAGISPEAVWNAGMTAALSTFVISRLLLIAFNLHSFLQYPLLILALPSLTTLGVLITALFMLGYLRWCKLRLLPLLDAAAPCAALLWGFLSLGREFDGTRDGMPTHPWPIGSTPIATRPQPVELFTALGAFFVFLGLLITLKKQHTTRRIPAGTVTAIAFVAFGFLSFFLDFLRLPSDLFPDLWLDPSQIIGIAMVLTGAALLARANRKSTPESGNEPPHAV